MNRGRDIEFYDRRCFHKIGRIIYKFLRAVYVSYIFYLVPFTTILVSFGYGYPYPWNKEPRGDYDFDKKKYPY